MKSKILTIDDGNLTLALYNSKDLTYDESAPLKLSIQDEKISLPQHLDNDGILTSQT